MSNMIGRPVASSGGYPNSRWAPGVQGSFRPSRLLPVVFLAVAQRQRHPAMVVRQRHAFARKQLKRAAEAIDGIVQLGGPSPNLHRLLIVVGDEPLRIARVRAGGKFIEQGTQRTP